MTEATEQRIREQAADLERRWSTDPRWQGVERTYTAEDVIRLQGSFKVEHSIARAGAERLWDLIVDRYRKAHPPERPERPARSRRR